VSHIDHRLHQVDFRDQNQYPDYPKLGISLAELEKQDLIVLIGSNVRHAQPLACHRIRKAALHGSEVVVINPVDFEFNFKISDKRVVGLLEIPSLLAGVAKALLTITNGPIPAELSEAVKLLKTIEYSDSERVLAEKLKAAKTGILIRGDLVWQHPQAADIRFLTEVIAKLSQLNCGDLTPGANTAGAWLAGAVPHRGPAGQAVETVGLHVKDMWAKPFPGYLLQGIEPELDCAQPALALKALGGAECVVALSAYLSPSMRAYADVLLPIAPFAETEGTFVNVEGRWQTFRCAVKPTGEVRSGWKVLRVLGNTLGVDGFNYCSAGEVLERLKGELSEHASPEGEKNLVPDYPMSFKINNKSNSLMRIGYWPLYCTDSLVRQAEPLQQIQKLQGLCGVRISPALAARLQLKAGDTITVSQEGYAISLPVIIDARVVDDRHVIIPTGFPETAGLAEVMGPITLHTEQKHV